MAQRNELQPQVGRAVSAQVPEQQQPVKPVVIDAEFSEVKNETKEAKAAPDQGQGQKIGAGHFKAMARLGLKELAQALPAFPDSTIKPVEEPGAYGNITPQIATDQMGYDSALADSAHRGQFQNQDKDREMSR